MQHENGPGGSPERENNQELTQEDLELRDSIFDDEDSMAAFRKVRPTMSLEDFNKLNHDQLNELAADIAKRLESEKSHKEFLHTVNNFDFALVTTAAQELGMEVRTVQQLNDLDDFSIARISDRLIRKHGRDGKGAAPAQTQAPAQQPAQQPTPAADDGSGYTQAGNLTEGGYTAPYVAVIDENGRVTLEDNYEAVKAAELKHAEQDYINKAQAMQQAQNDLESVLGNSAEGGELSEAEKNYRDNAISNLHLNDAWLRDVAGVNPSELGNMSTVDLSKLFDRFLDEDGASYVPAEAGGAGNPEGEQVQNSGAEQRDNSSEQREKKKKASRLGMRVAAAVAAIGLLGGGLFAGLNGAKKDKVRASNETTYTTTIDGDQVLPSERVLRNITGAETTESAEDEEGIWDAKTGNDARGLFANEKGDGINQDKLAEFNLVDDEEFANEDLSTEQGVKNFKEHFIKVNERQAANMAMFADYMSIHGGQKYIPESIRNLTGEALEDAIIENKDGCYEELCKNYEDFVNNAKVRKGTLEGGKYLNYYAKQVNPDAPLTKDNIELIRQYTSFEKSGTPCFVFESEDGITYTVKQVCAQAVTEITGNPVTPPPSEETPPPSEETPPPSEETPPPSEETPPPDEETPPPDEETPPPDEETPPPDEETPPPDEETPPPDEETPPPSEETPPPDNSKKEDELAAGQGGNVKPVEAGEQEKEDLTQQDYDPAHPVVEQQSPESLTANQDQAGDINDTAEGAAQRQAQEEAAAEQQQINEERNDDVAAQPDYDALNADHF